MSVMSFNTVTHDKYYIPPDADLDQVMTKLMSKKSKHILAQEAHQQEYFNLVKEQAR